MKTLPRLLVWNYTKEEKMCLDAFLTEVKAPPAFSIEKHQGHLLVREIINREKPGDQEFVCNEKVVLFYNIPNPGISFLIQASKQRDLPQPIYAVVTEHSINWPFSELVSHLIRERNAARDRAGTAQTAVAEEDSEG